MDSSFPYRTVICFFGDSANMHFRKWVRYFVKQGYETHCVTCSRQDVEGSTMHYVGYGMGKADYVLAMPRVVRIVRQIKPSLIHIHFLSGYGLLSLPLLFGERPLIGTAWGSDVLIAPAKSYIAKQVVKIVLKKSKFLIAVSPQLKEVMVNLGADSNKVAVLPIGVDTKVFIPAAYRDGHLLKVLSLNSHEPVYNTGDIIKAVAEVKSQGLDIKAVLVGKGSETERLRAQVASLGLDDCIYFPGRVSLQELLALLQESQVYVSMASSGGTPVSLLEAMACGAFPIVTDIPGHREWIESGFNGILVPQGSAHLLVKAILKVADGSIDRQKARVHNRKLVLQKADWDSCMLDAEKIYREVTGCAVGTGGIDESVQHNE